MGSAASPPSYQSFHKAEQLGQGTMLCVYEDELNALSRQGHLLGGSKEYFQTVKLSFRDEKYLRSFSLSMFCMLDWFVFGILLIYSKTFSDALKSGNRQNGALPYLKLQDGQ